MKKILLSIRPKWCSLIANNKKKIDVRKGAPEEVPFKCYIYCTKHGKELIKQDIPTTIDYIAHNGGKVIGEFVCDKIKEIFILPYWQERYAEVIKKSCLTDREIMDYLNMQNGYAWHISELKIYDKPKELSEFLSCPYKKMKLNCELCEYYGYSGCGHRITRPPQSWQYVEVKE